jgi:hypothetical protein
MTMKDFMTKIKTLDYKQFGLDHGEKIGIGVVGLIVVICLFLTTWASDYTGEPRDMEKKADDVTDQLRRNAWTEDRKKEFPYVLADNELPRIEKEIDPADYEWLVDPSPKLHNRQQPAEECEWLPVVELLAASDKFPLGITVEVAEPPPEEDSKPKPRSSGRRGAAREADDGLVLPPGAGMGTGTAAGSAEKASGRRVVAVTGVVEIRRQEQALMRAQRAGSLSEVRDRLIYRGLKLQRQRAVPGPDPWPKDEASWKDVNTETSIEVLQEASDFDPEIVLAKYTNGEFTSPLPRRLDGEWDVNKIGHPRIPTLTEEERQQEMELTRIAAESLKEQGEAAEGEAGFSFSRVQKDANRLRRQAQGTEAGSRNMNDYMDRMRSMAPPSGARGPGAGHGSGPPPAMSPRRGATPTPMAGHAMPRSASPMRMPGAPNMRMEPDDMRMRMASGGAMSGFSDTGAEVQLFRYLDFDVEPGECYRYRVKLIVDNPNFEEAFVSQPTVAEGKFRETPWSAPTPPVVVDRDVEYGLVKIKSDKGRVDGAELEVVQFDSSLGSYIMSSFPVYFGAFVGKDKQKTMHLDFLTPTFKEEPVNFTSKDILLDSTGTPSKFSEAAEADLKLDKKNSTKFLDMAVTFDRFGELVELDASSIQDLKSAKDRVDEERKPYEDIKVTEKDRKKKEAEVSSLDLPDAKPGKKGRKKKKGGAANPLKGGYSSSAAMMMQNMTPGSGAAPGGGRKGRGSKP